MTTFTASNGIVIRVGNPTDHHPLTVVGLGLIGTTVDALREFFRAEEDERLGRWRDPDNPEFLVYSIPGDDSRVYVFDETTGVHYAASREGARGGHGSAAHYFDAHPERKPWHDAKPGETWRLTVNDRSPLEIDLTFNVIGVEGVIPSRFARPQVGGEQMEYPLDSPAITAGRRIWPEVSS